MPGDPAPVWWDHRRRTLRALTKNLFSALSPRLVSGLRRHTGRGRSSSAPADVADYYRTVFAEHLDMLAAGEDPGSLLRNAVVVEYGPGDCLGVALLAAAHGAQGVVCVDRFPLHGDAGYEEVYRALLQGLPAEAQARALDCFRNRDPSSGFAADGPIEYRVDRSGRCGVDGTADLVWSRAALEHVADPGTVLADSARALRSGGRFVHKIDLRSHGMYGAPESMEFLRAAPGLWRLMASHSGIPNRARKPDWLRLAAEAGLEVDRAEDAQHFTADELARVRPLLAAPYRRMSDEALLCAALWLVGHKP